MLRVMLSRLVTYRSFWRFLLAYIAAMPLLFYVGANLSNLFMNGSMLPIGQWFSRPQAWTTVAALTRWLLLIPAFFTVQIVCAELELRIVRAHITAGLERRDVVAGWVLQGVLFTGIGCVVSLLTVVLLAHGSRYGGGDGNGDWALATMLRPQLGLLIYGIAFLNVAVLCAVLLRRPVPTISLLLTLPSLIEPLLAWLLGKYDLAAAADYLPFHALDSLVPLPGGAPFDPGAPLTMVAIAYAALAAVLAWLRLRHDDL